MREIVHIQAGQCGNQIGAKVRFQNHLRIYKLVSNTYQPIGYNIEHIRVIRKLTSRYCIQIE